MFFGRRSILEDIKTHVGGGTKVILLEGNRRTGKTSILRQLQRPENGLLDSWVIVYCSLQGITGHPTKTGIPTESVFRAIARLILDACDKAGCPVPLPDAPSTSTPLQISRALTAYFKGVEPYEALEIYVDKVIQAIAPRRLLLMIDEFDKLQEGIDSGVTSPQVPENIRHLLQTRLAVSAIITGLGRLRRLREQYWSALFGFGLSIGVTPLEPAEVRKLVTEPVDGRLTFDGSSVELIAELTARQPYLVQYLCDRIFDLAKAHGLHRIRPDQVSAAADAMVQDFEHFEALWRNANTERRRYLMCLCNRLAGSAQRLNADVLNEYLAQGGILVSTAQVDEDLKFLVDLELVKLENTPIGPNYELAVPLMKRWMGVHVDGDAQRRKAEVEQHHAGPGFIADSGPSVSNNSQEQQGDPEADRDRSVGPDPSDEEDRSRE